MPTPHSLKYGQTVIEYQLTYTERDTLAIHVHPDTHVTVEAPRGSQFADIEKRIHKRAAWILRQQRIFRRFSFDIPPRKYVSGETHRLLGRQYRLMVIQSADGKEIVNKDREQIVVHVRDKNKRSRVKRLLLSWYRRQTLDVAGERLETWFPRFERYDIKRPKISIREMRSRWGSCTPGGKLTLNLKLVMVPKQFIDYIIVHELCHVIEQHHSQAFYKLLSRIMPDWEEEREKLNRYEF